MKITLVRSMARSAVFELVNSGCYRAPAPYTVSLDGATVCEGDTNVFSLYSLEPGRSYTPVSYTHLTLPTILRV